MMNNILFVWSKHNPVISYRQGMNELAAILLFTAYRESIGPDVKRDTPEMEVLAYLNDEKYLEADCYIVFTKLMAMGHAEMFAHQQPPKDVTVPNIILGF